MATRTSRASHAPSHKRHPPRAAQRSASRKVSHRRASAAQTRRVPIENTLERIGQRIQKRLGRAPYLAAAGAGLGVFALANAIGVGEIALSVAGAYVVLRLLRDRASPEEALREGLSA